MKKILILVAISLFLCSTASAGQGGGGESTKKGSSKKVVMKKKTSGTTSANTKPPRPPASPVPTRTPTSATTKEQAADRERRYEELRIAGIAERTRVEQGMAGEWSDGPSRLTITSEAETKLVNLKQKRADLLVDVTQNWPEVREIDEQIALNGSRFSVVYVSGATNILGELLPQGLHGELLPDNQLRLANDSFGKLVNPRYYYGGDFDKEAWIELGVDGSFLNVRFSEAKGGRSIVMKRLGSESECYTPCTLYVGWEGVIKTDGQPVRVKFNGKVEWLDLSGRANDKIPLEKFAPGEAQFASPDEAHPHFRVQVYKKR
jgi:hypothetical protein